MSEPDPQDLTDGCTLCRAGFKGPHGHIQSIAEFRQILVSILKEQEEFRDYA